MYDYQKNSLTETLSYVGDKGQPTIYHTYVGGWNNGGFAFDIEKIALRNDIKLLHSFGGVGGASMSAFKMAAAGVAMEVLFVGMQSLALAKGGSQFVKISSTGIKQNKNGITKFSLQARFPKYNLNLRFDRGFRAPFKNPKVKYFGETYNGFNTHINIQKIGRFNYHIILNPLKWKYYGK